MNRHGSINLISFAGPRYTAAMPATAATESFSAAQAPQALAAAPLSRRAEWAAGQPISMLMAQALANPQLISLAAGFVDQATLPVEEVRIATEAVLSDPGHGRAALQYGSTPGYLPLREMILADLKSRDGHCQSERNVNVEQVVLTAGSNQLLHLVCESLLDPGDIVLCAAPTYFVFLGTLANLGARAVSVDTDEHGMIPEALALRLEALAATGQASRVKMIYLVTYSDNPAGVTMPADRRRAVVEIAQRWSQRRRLYVVADDAYRQLTYHGDDPPSLRSFDEKGQTVIAAGTYSKSFAPGLRVGWGVLPRPLVEPVCNQKGNIDFGSPHLSQNVMAKVHELGLYEPHVAGLRLSYRRKMETLLAAASEFFGDIAGARWITPRGGLYVWMELPEEIDTGLDGRLFKEAVKEGVLYVPGQYCFAAEGAPVRRHMMRLSFGVQPCERIRKGMAALARAVTRCLE